MKTFTTFAVIAISLLTTIGCKPTQNAPAQSPVTQDMAAVEKVRVR